MKQQTIENLKRIWKALKRELGNTEDVRDEFLNVCKHEFNRLGLVYVESEIIDKIIVN